MSFSTIIVLGRYQSAAGPASGTVTFTRSARLRDTSTGEVLLANPVVAHLDSEGIVRIALAATNDPTTLPTGQTYTVTEAAGDCTRTYAITVPYDAPNGTLDLVSVATGSPPGAVALYAVTGGSGGGGSLTPPVTLAGTQSAASILTVEAAAAQTAPYLVVKRDTDWQGASMIEGQDETGAQLWYLDENGALWASHDIDAGGTITATGSLIAGANSSITGSLSVSGVVTGGTVGATQLVVGGAFTVMADGTVILPALTMGSTTPNPGTAYLYLDTADNTVKVKTSDGVVHPLW